LFSGTFLRIIILTAIESSFLRIVSSKFVLTVYDKKLFTTKDFKAIFEKLSLRSSCSSWFLTMVFKTGGETLCTTKAQRSQRSQKIILKPSVVRFVVIPLKKALVKHNILAAWGQEPFSARAKQI